MKAKQLPSGNYRVQVVAGYDENGKRIVKSFTAEKEWQALKKASDFLESNDNSLNQSITLRKAMEKYIDSKKNIIEETTLLLYHYVLECVFQNIMDIKLKDLNILILQQEINRESKRLSPKTIRTSYGVLRGVLLMYEVDLNYKKINLPKIIKKNKELPPFKSIFKIVKGTSIELPVLLACWLSLRKSEVLGLKFKDVDLKDKTIRIRRTIVRTQNGFVIREGCKTESSQRTIQLPDYILNLIKSIDHVDEESFIIQMASSTLYVNFKRIMKENGIDITFHDLRHLNASIMLMLGVPDKYAMERGGWSTNEVLKYVYQQTFKSEKKKVDNIIDSYFSEIIKNSSD